MTSEHDLPHPEAEAIEASLSNSKGSTTADTKSSSTEGPDSHSNSSSPVSLGDIMVPVYPVEHDNADDSTGDVLLPLFTAKISQDQVNKDGDTLRYKIRVKKLASDQDHEINIEREYDDFEFLHHTLITHNQIVGIIIPPLPTRPAADPQAAESKSRKQLGSSSKAMAGDDFKSDAKHLERYLQQMLRHPVFGRDSNLEEFLVHANPPIRARIKKGFLAGMRETLDQRKTSGVKDPDDFFQKEKEWALAYSSNIRETCDKFHGLVNAQMRFANQMTHLATVLNASVGGHEGSNAFYNRLNSRFSTCLEESERAGIENAIGNQENTLGDYLAQWTSYLEAENSMLHRRTGLFLEVEAATKALSKAKASKAHAARKLKVTCNTSSI